MINSELITKEQFEGLFLTFAGNYNIHTREQTVDSYYEKLKGYSAYQIMNGMDKALDFYTDRLPTLPQLRNSISNAIKDKKTGSREPEKTADQARRSKQIGDDFMGVLNKYMAGKLNNREYREENRRLCEKGKLYFDTVKWNYYLKNPDFRASNRTML